MYADRVAKHYTLGPTNPQLEIHGQSVENFAMSDNLMMRALNDAGADIQPSFRATVVRIAADLQARLSPTGGGASSPWRKAYRRG